MDRYVDRLGIVESYGYVDILTRPCRTGVSRELRVPRKNIVLKRLIRGAVDSHGQLASAIRVRHELCRIKRLVPD